MNENKEYRVPKQNPDFSIVIFKDNFSSSVTIPVDIVKYFSILDILSTFDLK
jgi:hypothetical protein